ncbi:MAG: FAD-binding protein [Rhizobiaceae bacterium]
MSEISPEGGADLHPKTKKDVLDAVSWAAAEQVPLEIIGQGSKRSLGHPVQSAHSLDMSGLSGVTLFEPEELVLSAKAGTPIAEIIELLDEHNQELQFEPMDLGPLLGKTAGLGTLGGLISTNFCGSRRLKAGSARDHILGVTAVSGRGEEFKSGGRVVKNVTGYDLSKGITGAYGTLAVLTDIIIKVLPKSETEQTLVLNGLSDADASRAMAMAMGSNGEVSGAAHLPAGIAGTSSTTLLRLEGFAPSVDYRINNLAGLLSEFDRQQRLDASASRAQWQFVRDCQPFSSRQDRCVWRISCVPSEGHKIVHAIAQLTSVEHFFDWQGGLVWLQVEEDDPRADLIRAAVRANGGGHATLVRATMAQRQSVSVFEPQGEALAALSKRYRENFDPHGILNPGRMGV